MSCYDWYWLRVSIADRMATERFARPKRLGRSFVVDYAFDTLPIGWMQYKS